MHPIALPLDRHWWRSPLLSAAAHILAIAVAISLPMPKQRAVEPPPPVRVTIVAPDPLGKALSGPDPGQALSLPSRAPDLGEAPRAVSIPRISPSPPDVDLTSPSMVRPKNMLSELALANPRNAKALRQLRTFSADERMVQLCNIEAMEQLHVWDSKFVPQQVAPYAFKGLRLGGGSVIADGAAFYSGGNWYALRFECAIQANKVVAFAFSVGGTVPRSDWEANDLAEPADDDDN